MRIREALILLWTTIGLGLAGCASNPAPRNWLPTPEHSGRDPYGGWVEVDHTDVSVQYDFLEDTRKSRKRIRIEGELLAIDKDSLWVLGDSMIVALPLNNIIRAKAAGYSAEYGGLAAWTVLGSLSTIGNGVFLTFTFPMWVIGGTAATASYSGAPIVTFYPRPADRPESWQRLRPYARFPQGLPRGVSRDSLKYKTVIP